MELNRAMDMAKGDVKTGNSPKIKPGKPEVTSTEIPGQGVRGKPKQQNGGNSETQVWEKPEIRNEKKPRIKPDYRNFKNTATNTDGRIRTCWKCGGPYTCETIIGKRGNGRRVQGNLAGPDTREASFLLEKNHLRLPGKTAGCS
ncbi:Hypothetical protein CINCED_3A009353 [Cinara cedri]|uniref:Uncharacterized protein n=1 Tax=Cinara cedri TaxID=506608 RepID=A0A5E4M4I7_9HEMI|nr:Hypothetical protein CINCED_3A009353 [Cinara cedri]